MQESLQICKGLDSYVKRLEAWRATALEAMQKCKKRHYFCARARRGSSRALQGVGMPI